MDFPSDISAAQFRAFMHQPANQVSGFLRACAQQRWVNPPLDVPFADVLTAEEAEALLGADGGGSLPIRFSVRSQTSFVMSTQMRTSSA
jgi:hypothetical protein